MTAGSVLEAAGLLTVPLLVAIYPVDPYEVAILPAPSLMRKAWGRGIGAMTLRRWVFVDPRLLQRGGDDFAWMVVHELAHVRQWLKGPIRFLWGYLSDYLSGRRRGLNHRGAYLEVKAEREARELVTRLRG